MTTTATPKADAATLAILGSGVQARSHLEAYAAVRPLTRVRIWSPHAASRERFVADMQPHVAARIEASDTAEAAVRGADLIVLVTSSPTPVIRDEWVGPGAHVVCVLELVGKPRAARRANAEAEANAFAPFREVSRDVPRGIFGQCDRHAFVDLRNQSAAAGAVSAWSCFAL